MFVTSLKDYQKLYVNSYNFKIKGDFSTPYLYFYEETIKNIKKYYNETKYLKFLIMLRNPIERAFSQYAHHIRDLAEDLSFEEAVKSEKIRMQKNYHFDYFYIDRGFYYKQVKAYIDNFENVKIIIFDDFKKDPYGIMVEIFDFLELDVSFLKNVDFGKKFNISGKPKIKTLIKLIYAENLLLKFAKKSIPKNIRETLKNLIFKYNLDPLDKNIKEETIEYLKELYKEDIEKLSDLIDVDLTHWLR
jgi:hypothetical protein